MRRLSQLRTPESSNGDQPDLDRVGRSRCRAAWRSTGARPVSRSPDRDGARSRRQGQPQTGRRSFCATSFWIGSWAAGRCRTHRHQREHRCDHDGQFCSQAAELSRRIDWRAGGERHGERSGGIGRARRGPGRHFCARSRAAYAGTRGGGSRSGKSRARRGSPIAGGDTKVVEHGKADQMYVTTTGIGRLLHGVTIDPSSVRVGDKILLSGPIGDHGMTILLARGELDLEADLRSDTRSVLPLVETLVRSTFRKPFTGEELARQVSARRGPGARRPRGSPARRAAAPRRAVLESPAGGQAHALERRRRRSRAGHRGPPR